MSSSGKAHLKELGAADHGDLEGVQVLANRLQGRLLPQHRGVPMHLALQLEAVDSADQGEGGGNRQGGQWTLMSQRPRYTKGLHCMGRWHHYLSSTMLMRKASSPPLQTISAGVPPHAALGLRPASFMLSKNGGLHMQKWKASPLPTALASIPLGALLP